MQYEKVKKIREIINEELYADIYGKVRGKDEAIEQIILEFRKNSQSRRYKMRNGISDVEFTEKDKNTTIMELTTRSHNHIPIKTNVHELKLLRLWVDKYLKERKIKGGQNVNT